MRRRSPWNSPIRWSEGQLYWNIPHMTTDIRDRFTNRELDYFSNFVRTPKREERLRMFASGMTISEISEKLGCDKTQIGHSIRQALRESIHETYRIRKRQKLGELFSIVDLKAMDDCRRKEDTPTP